MVGFKEIGVIGVPQDLGASRRGVDMGPSAMRVANLAERITSLGYEVVDYGNLHCHDLDEHMNIVSNQNLRYLKEIKNTCIHLKESLADIMGRNQFPLVLGGDHSLSIGTLAGIKEAGKRRVGIIWVDAHGDFNTPETTPSGNIHGMPFAVLTGRGDDQLLKIGPSPTVVEENSVLIAARDLDKGEIELLEQSKVTVFTMRHIDEIGISKVARKAISIAVNGTDHLHLSFDIDSVDPENAPGTGTRVNGGMTFREAHLLMELIHESGKLSSLEMVEVNPTLDVRNKTAQLAVDLIISALGKKILR